MANYLKIGEGKSYETALSNWAGRKYIGDSGAIEVKAECHMRPFIPCVTANTSYWCYTSTKSDTTIRSSRDLLLLGQGYLPAPSQAFVYLTEGIKSTTHPNFFQSLEIVLAEKITPGFYSSNFSFNESAMVRTPGVIACSISARITSAIATSFDIAFSGDYAEFNDYQILANGTHETDQPVLFHQHWLEGISNINPNDEMFGKPTTATGNVSLGTYHIDARPNNPTLESFAKTLIDPYEQRMYYSSLDWKTMEAAELEVILGGAFASILLYLPPADSQYVLPPTLQMPDHFLPRPQYYEHPTNFTLEVYNLGYGFRLSSRSGKLGIVVLLGHAILALLGSLWQLFFWRRIVKAWRSVPEYLALGIGSPSEQERFDNTCVGISGMRTLQTVVRIEERFPDHLEVSSRDREYLETDEDPTDSTDSANGILAVRPSLPILKRFKATYGSTANIRRSYGAETSL